MRTADPESHAENAPGEAPATGQRSSRGTLITTITATIGGLALLGVTGIGLFTGYGYSVATISYGGEEYPQVMVDEQPSFYYSGDGIERVDIDASAAVVSLGFADVEEISFEAADGLGNPIDGWNMYTEGSSLVVERVDNWGCVMDCELPENRQFVTITLPQSLAETGTLQVDAGVEGGRFNAEGRFGRFGIDAHASDVAFNGSASELGLAISGGSAEIEVAESPKATFEAESSTVALAFGEVAPDRLVIDATMSRVDATLPDGKYRVQGLSESSGVENELKTSEKSKHVIRVETTASDVTLR